MGQEVDADDREIMRCPAFLFRVPAELESQLAPDILRKVPEVERGPRPSILVRNNVLPGAGFLGGSLVAAFSWRRKDLSDIGH